MTPVSVILYDVGYHVYFSCIANGKKEAEGIICSLYFQGGWNQNWTCKDFYIVLLTNK